MNKRTTNTIMTQLKWAAFFLALLFLVIQVIPHALGQQQTGQGALISADDEQTGLDRSAPAASTGTSTIVGAPGANCWRKVCCWSRIRLPTTSWLSTRQLVT